MNLVLSKIFAPVLASLILISTSWMPLHIHLCMGELAEISILQQIEDCPKDYQEFSCHQSVKKENKECCDDQTTFLKSSGDFIFSFAQLTDFTADYQFIITKYYFIQEIYSAELAFNLPPDPPPLIASSPTLPVLQSFLL